MDKRKEMTGFIFETRKWDWDFLKKINRPELTGFVFGDNKGN